MQICGIILTMKIFAIITACILSAFLSGCRQQDFRTTEIRIPNVINSACESRVRDALKPLKGIEMEKLVFKDGTLTVRYDSMMLGVKNIEHAIKDAGFDANDFPADPAARAKLPQECLIMATK